MDKKALVKHMIMHFRLASAVGGLQTPFVLAFVQRNQGTTLKSLIAASQGLDETTFKMNQQGAPLQLGAVVSSLVKTGLLKQEVNKQDRRKKHLHLTEMGRKRLTEIESITGQIE